MNLAPTASTTAMLALGDALAIAVSLRKGFQPEDFADLHPGGKLLGVISDGDLRRLWEREDNAAFSKKAGEAMNAHPRTIAASELAAKALAILEERKITSLIVVDAEGRVEGVVHLHDLWGVELI